MMDSQVFSPADQRKLFSLLPTGVTAITGMTEQDQPIGMVVGTFQSLSLEPALVTFCVDRSSSTWPMLRSQGKFTANILSTDQMQVCKALGRKGPNKFDGLDFKMSAFKTPHIADSVAWIDCQVISEIMVGDHFMIVGSIHNFQIGHARALAFSEGKLSECKAIVAEPVCENSDMATKVSEAWAKAWSQGQTDAFNSIVGPHYVRYSKDGRCYKVEDVVNQIHEARSAFSNYRIEIIKTLQEGDFLALHWKAIAIHTGPYMGVPPTFKEMTVRGASFMKHQNGLITEEWMVWDPLDFLTSIEIWQIGRIA